MSLATATQLWRMSATELAAAIRSKQASSREVVEAHLRRIEAINPSVNAVTIALAIKPWKPRTQPTARSPQETICRRFTAFPSRSRRTSTWSALPPPWD